ncbi:MAG: tetratricopeptide repeat protein [Planctomycetota bacterium]|nr:tetratricopeptide repeat protein [Planctomycetota bacterium]
MASKVNVKFVVLLAVVLIVLFGGVAYLGFQAFTNSGEDYVRMGDEAAEQGDWLLASDMYERAVGQPDGRTKTEWLEKWKDALLKTTPDTEIEYQRAYGDFYIGILAQLARLQLYEAAPQREFLEALYQQNRLTGPSPEPWQRLVSATDEARRSLPEGDPASDALLRYRGLANLQLLQLLPDAGNIREETRNDLRTAFEADPQDIEAALGIVRWYTLEWSRHLRERREEQANVNYQAALEEINTLRQQFPNHPSVIIADLALRGAHAVESFPTPADRRRALERLRPLLDEAEQALRTAPVEQINDNIISQFHTIARLLRPEEADDVALSLIDRVLAEEPDNVRMQYARARRLRDLERFDEAIAQLEQVVELPDRPVSLEGLLLKSIRTSAIDQQAQCYLAKWETTDDQTAKQRALENARERRNTLVERLPSGADSAPALLLDAKLALAEGRYDIAVQKLHDLDNLRGAARTDPEVLKLLARSMEAKGEFGAAQAEYDRLLALTPWDLQVIRQAVRLDFQLRDTDKAFERLVAALELFPDDEMLQGWMMRVRAMRGDVTGIDDPAMAALVEIDRILKEADPDYEAAREIATSARADYPDNVSLLHALISIEANSNRPNEVRRLVNEGLEAFPNDARLREIQDRFAIFEADDRVAAVIAMIERSDLPEHAKAVQKYTVYKRAEMPERADEVLDEAERLYPDQPVVIDTLFVRALEREEMDKARQIAARAARLNVDLCDGALFEARLALAENDTEVALRKLETAVERLPTESRVWQLRGRVLLERGQVDQAIESLRKAFEFRPQDAETAEVFARALVQVQRNGEALTVARRARQFNPSDRELTEIWLRLEELAGDPAVAASERTRRMRANPGDEDNKIALASLLLTLERWDEARQIIDEAKPFEGMEQRYRYDILASRWHAMQGDVETGKQILLDYIADVPQGELTVEPYIALGRFLIDFNREDQGIAAFREGARYQGQDMAADRVLANYFFDSADTFADRERRRARYEQALEPYRRMIEQNATDKNFAILRYVETLLRIQRYDDAEKALNQYASGMENDLRVLLLRAQAARGKGDNSRALAFVDRAVQNSPGDARPFILRAQFNFNDEVLFNDVLADLNQALDLQPGSVQARQMKASLFIRRNRPNDALTEMKRGVELNPNSDDMRSALLSQLVAMQRFDEALTEARAAVDANPGIVKWMLGGGEIAMRYYQNQRERGNARAAADNAAVAVQFLEEAFEARPDSNIGFRLATALLRCQPPRAGRVLEIVDELGDETVDRSSNLMIVKARALMEQDKDREALDLAGRALQLVDTNDELVAWDSEMKLIMNDLKELAIFMKNHQPRPEVAQLYEVHLIRVQLPDSEQNPNELVSRLKAVLAQTDPAEDAYTQVEAYRLLGALYYGQEKFREAADAFRQGTVLVPDDLEFNNNLAFTLAKHLDTPGDALAPAEKAAELAPTNSAVLDTLGWVLFRLEQWDRAEQVLIRAIDAARGGRELIPAKLHLASVREKKGNKADAQRLANEVREEINNFKRRGIDFETEYGREVDDLMRRLNQAE